MERTIISLDYAIKNILHFDEAIANDNSIIRTAEIKGEKKGEKKKAIAIAKNLIALGTMTQEQIAQATGLSIAEIKAL